MTLAESNQAFGELLSMPEAEAVIEFFNGWMRCNQSLIDITKAINAVENGAAVEVKVLIPVGGGTEMFRSELDRVVMLRHFADIKVLAEKDRIRMLKIMEKIGAALETLPELE